MPHLNWVDFERLRREIREMSPRSLLYRLLKEELTALGYWRNRPRGKPDAVWFAGKDENK